MLKIKNIYKTTTKQITTILFDLDNTLIPTRTGDNKAISKVSENNFYYNFSTFEIVFILIM